MLSSFTGLIKNSLGADLNGGLMTMFLFLHFYYGLIGHSWEEVGRGAVTVIFGSFILVLVIVVGGRGQGLKAGLALIMAALCVDHFFRGQLSQPATLTFEYFDFGAATLNFASFGFSAVWLFSADPMVSFGRDS
ncbi:TPA: hypothetical protein ACIR1J_002915 [Pseudomonas aeruginosa]|uniref:hypothetical protein n=1 Tax=Pseudomonas aeruginosa TaxID=287 RepID=UPI001A3195AD|nr:hypothetical protein [Pseudomonas aeruginosa]MBJ7547397.1 hypothetical protein [Pseudomonas sp. OA3]MDV7945699.1 hypothetical protein [Pseudomonas aeruginosa]